jgi:antitoxin YefM
MNLFAAFFLNSGTPQSYADALDISGKADGLRIDSNAKSAWSGGRDLAAQAFAIKLAPLFVQVGIPMKIVSYSEARSSLKSILDAVHDDADVTVISRRDGSDAVVMSFDHYQSIMATMHLLSTPANAAHLAKSIAQHKAGKSVRRELATK